ncbi:MAG: M18 family aminopeptidase [Ectothiorhodospiraceae bacterium]|nr:M18 family aminopeptidase [Ectothiorhodospiraceae bacterium]
MAAAEHPAARALLDFIDRSPSPWHAVASCVQELATAGYQQLNEGNPWRLESGQGYYVIRDDSSLIAFHTGSGAMAEHGSRIIGAHTDSPGFRVKPNPLKRNAGLDTVGVEIYGGPIVATFADRDLTLAGRVVVRDGNGELHTRLYRAPNPVLRFPNLAIHLNRTVNQEGLKYDLHQELPLILGTLQEALPSRSDFQALLARELGTDAEAVVSWELAVADTQPGAFFGLEREYIADSQLDNLASCHAALEALLTAPEDGYQGLRLIALFDHEEIGSQSFKGADGPFLQDVLDRLSEAFLDGTGAARQARARSLVLSADMAHAHHPNYARYYDLEHAVHPNRGPVIKLNANQRYATDGVAEAVFETLCQEVEVPVQRYVHRNDLPCGSTIGPITAGRLGIRCADIGNAMWSMHSLRESAGALDHDYMIRTMRHFLTRERLPLREATP